VKEMDEASLVIRLNELERENRILKQKLQRSIQNRRQLEETLETHSNALKMRNAELEESRGMLETSEARYRELALHDTLTGLPNRAYFNALLDTLTNKDKDNKKYTALLFMDLDFFKIINDDMGHKAGDAALIIVAKRLLSCIRMNDIAARLGGDEFAIILPDIDNFSIVECIARRIINEISSPLCVDGEMRYLGVSIGISLYPLDTEDNDKLLQYADKAMYRVKKDGKNSYKYYQNAI
jgi:diguanylate cyclase (GGDEF)-like protein